MAGAEKRNITKSKIVNYIINHEATSKVELSKDLNLSMPTVLSNVNELLANGIARTLLTVSANCRLSK